MGMEQFFTRDKANEGVKVNLMTPDGQMTDEYILIRSQWADEFQRVKAEIYRDDIKAASEKREIDPAERHSRLTAALVAGWSFDKECTPESALELMREAPQLRDMIDRYASNDARFFGKPSSDSTTGRKQK